MIQIDPCTIGLFGTCGGSKWRGPFMDVYQRNGIPFFNPQVENWTPEMAQIEAEHLIRDSIVLFPVTSETAGIGSLSETGFSIAQAMRADDRREFVIMIDPKVNDLGDPKLEKESVRTRALVRAHLNQLRLPNVYLVNTLVDMLDVSMGLYEIVHRRQALTKYNPQNRG